MAKLSDLMISKVRVELLEVFFQNPEEMYYIRQLTRIVDEEINAVRRELIHLAQAGLIKEEKRGNRTYYSVNRNYLFYKDLMGMVGKTTGLGKLLLKEHTRLGHVKFIMISGRYVRHMPRRQDTVDLLIIGDVILPTLAEFIKTAEGKLSREINYTVMTETELIYRKTHNDPFIERILCGSRVMVLGDEEDLVA
ncbi:MAG: helix-turn-helix transcriptional regulator [bacterium]